MNRAGTTCPVPGKTWEGSGGEVRLGPRRFACLALPVLVLAAVEVGAGYTTIVDNGTSDNRVDVVFLGDGYTAADLGAGAYSTHIDATLDHIFSDGEEPFVRYRNFFNVHRIDVVSAESGADIPAEGIYRNTALDASYEGSSLAVSGPKADAAMAAGLQGAGFSAEIKLVTVNHTTYGGGAGAGGYAVYAGGSAYGSEAALHEMGHTFVSLADEYVTRDAAYTGPEPPEANITAGADPGNAKWAAWIGYTDPGHPGMGAIGLYEGARYYKYGLYRPSVSSKMRTLGQPFDAVSREQIILRIYERVDPLDRWLPNDSVVTDPAQLWVEVVDSDVIGVQWSVDGSPVQGATEQMFDLLRHGFGPGEYEVKAVAYDETIGDWVRRDIDAMRMAVTWTVRITPQPATFGDADGDGLVQDDDLSAALAHWGTAGGWRGGDFNWDQTVDNQDLSLLLAHWTGAIAPDSAGVPEPAAMGLVALGGLLLQRGRRDRAVG